jgi:hypothetical protein
VTGKRLLKRLVSVILGMLGFFLFLHAVDADAVTAAVGSRPSAVSHNVAYPIRLPAFSSRLIPSETKRQSLRVDCCRHF